VPREAPTEWFAQFRTGNRYDKRPPANRIAARRAWDDFAEDGPVLWIQLLDGYWGCCRPNDDGSENEHIEEREAQQFSRTQY
jgi:hypothetical protein